MPEELQSSQATGAACMHHVVMRPSTDDNVRAQPQPPFSFKLARIWTPAPRSRPPRLTWVVGHCDHVIALVGSRATADKALPSFLAWRRCPHHDAAPHVQ
ncbi:hypothetical protein ZWY2020_025978 [Hordeum vulgare]|nr:hypothetical protein ZWY2020_025978 [Hordeum vulgare]